MLGNRFFLVVLIFACLIGRTFAVGQAAAISLNFPPGGRATGMGEAFTALADDVFTTYYNPAGLGQGPLANEWTRYTEPFENTGDIKVISGKRKLNIMEKNSIWASADSGLFRFNGKSWLGYDVIPLEQGDRIDDVLLRYINVPSDEKENYSEFIDSVRAYNNIVTEEDELLTPDIMVPFRFVVKFSINCLEVSEGGILHIGTRGGLYTYDGVSWRRITSLDGLPEDNITSVTDSEGELYVITNSGISYKKGVDWVLIDTSKGLPSLQVNSVFVSEGKAYVATEKGFAVMKRDEVTAVYDTSDGLLDNSVRDIAIDAESYLWAACKGGAVQIFDIADPSRWKKFRFKDNEVSGITVDPKDFIWIATAKGLFRYKKGKFQVKSKRYVGAEWIHFHGKNGMTGDRVTSLMVQGDDIWTSTPEGIARYDKADIQIDAFAEQLLPEFNLDDMYHAFSSITIPTEEWGTIGLLINYLNFGESDHTAADGRILGTFKSYEFNVGISYGLLLKQNLSIGLGLKYVYSDLAGGASVGNQESDAGQSFGVDLSVLKRGLFTENLDVGANLMNMGPTIAYIDEEQADPIPFSLVLGAAYHLFRTPVHEISAVFDINREMVYREGNDVAPFYEAFFKNFTDSGDSLSFFEGVRQEFRENVYSLGFEYVYSDFVAFRLGHMIDIEGSREENTFGFGLDLQDIVFDYSYITSSNIYGSLTGRDIKSVRNGQTRFSLILSI